MQNDKARLPDLNSAFVIQHSAFRMPSQRYKLTVAYRGTRYHGWQQQPALPSYKGEKASEFVPEAEREDEPQPEEFAAPGIGPAPGVEVDYIPTVQGELSKAIAS